MSWATKHWAEVRIISRATRLAVQREPSGSVSLPIADQGMDSLSMGTRSSLPIILLRAAPGASPKSINKIKS